jgi:DNA-nicking Smr family endonuclease
MSRRRLHPDERTLWTDVTRSIAPLPKRRTEGADEAEPVASPPVEAKAKLKPKSPIAAAPLAPSVPRPNPPPPAPLGRKARRRLARGSDAIDGRLDLHGMTQAQAHGALLGFLRAAAARGARVVLVITGKGARGDGPGERGVLKRQVPMWLRLPEFREFVVGFEAAGIGHGGDGAMYVRLRRERD